MRKLRQMQGGLERMQIFSDSKKKKKDNESWRSNGGSRSLDSNRSRIHPLQLPIGSKEH
jgi:hypothetical protein